MISSHTLDALFKPGEHHSGERAIAIWKAAREYARVITELVPQSQAVDTALRYAQLSALLAIHSIETTV